MKISKILPHFLLGVGIMMQSCNPKPYKISEGHSYIQKSKRYDKEWKLVWNDEFEEGEIDSEKWTKIPPNSADWGNYMTSDPKCYAFKDGKLILKGIKNEDQSKDGRPYLTGGVYTKGKFAFQYGKIEIRAKLGAAKGAWPAIWMLAEQNKYGNYPKNGEIDIMEHINFEDRIYQTTHSHYTLNLKQTDNPPHGGTADFDKHAFNTFGLEWYPDKLVFTLNGEPTFTYPRVENVDKSQWPYDQPFYLLIDMQLEGNWVGTANPDDLPVDMEVDWVRVYQ
ncbi:glycoside hydrolase family 16 protein [Echinicola shivajiensis]|uniref:glycoside hydrolase family 16 protein n=1 Tax=Echinicola shivajiensis TaxID=1035916 RepID=UPI001BFC0758|nr:glycoside hydrolase family 16 protein [Echinicola shivajiensis]